MKTTDELREQILMHLRMLELIARYSRYDQTNKEAISLTADAILSVVSAA